MMGTMETQGIVGGPAVLAGPPAQGPVNGRVNPLTSEDRPWGSWAVLEEGPGSEIERLEVLPGKRMSLQTPLHRSEHGVVVSGTARVIVGDKINLVHRQESTFVPPGTLPQIENPGLIPLVMIEIQNGEYLGEDDMVRLEDDDGRAGNHGDEIAVPTKPW